MNVLHFSTFDMAGGSAKSALRIHTSLCEIGVNSSMLVSRKDSDLENVAEMTSSLIQRKLNAVTSSVLSAFGKQYSYIPFSPGISKNGWLSSADIIQIYNIHGDYLSFDILSRLAKSAPIVIRLSDLWPFTGHCAYPGSCNRWVDGCGRCPDLSLYPAVGLDLTAHLWKKKQRFFRDNDVTIVAPSSWAYESAKKSPFIANDRIFKIYNGIDLRIFRESCKIEAREKLGIHKKYTAILFISEKAYPNPRKGTDILEAALRIIGCRKDICLIVVGHHSERWIAKVPIKVYSLGSITSVSDIIKIYSSADIVCVPSSDENLPNTIIESCAFGRPVVSMNTGGIKDGVHDLKTGILCKHKDPNEFAARLVSLIDDPLARVKMGSAARQLAEEKFDSKREADRFSQLYEEILQGKHGRPH